MPLAEECGLILELSDWVLEQACRQHAAWRTHGIDVPRIAVNLIASAFEQPTLVDMVRSLLERHGMDAWSLVLEITESVMLSEQPLVLENLHALHALGIDLSLDDFAQLLQPQPPAPPADQRNEAGPQLHRRDRPPQGRPFADPVGAAHRRKPGQACGGRRRGDRDPAPLPGGEQLPGAAGLPVRPGHARRSVRAMAAGP